MEQRNLEKALDVYAALITGQEISRSNPDTRDLYEEFYANAAVYDSSLHKWAYCRIIIIIIIHADTGNKRNTEEKRRKKSPYMM